MKVLFKILNFKTMMFLLVLGISIFLYKYLVSCIMFLGILLMILQTISMVFKDYAKVKGIKI